MKLTFVYNMLGVNQHVAYVHLHAMQCFVPSTCWFLWLLPVISEWSVLVVLQVITTCSPTCCLTLAEQLETDSWRENSQ